MIFLDFHEFKKRRNLPKADFRNPWMGFDGVICENPVYWCRLHEVWLSEEDVAKKRCLSRLTYDMIGYRRCTSLEKKEKNPFVREVSNG